MDTTRRFRTTFKIKVGWNWPWGRAAGTDCIAAFSWSYCSSKWHLQCKTDCPTPLVHVLRRPFAVSVFLVPFHQTHPLFCLLEGPSRERERERERAKEGVCVCVCVCVCVLAGSRSQLRDKAPLHTANSSLCVPPLPDAGTHTYKVFNPPPPPTPPPPPRPNHNLHLHPPPPPPHTLTPPQHHKKIMRSPPPPPPKNVPLCFKLKTPSFTPLSLPHLLRPEVSFVPPALCAN